MLTEPRVVRIKSGTHSLLHHCLVSDCIASPYPTNNICISDSCLNLSILKDSE